MFLKDKDVVIGEGSLQISKNYTYYNASKKKEDSNNTPAFSGGNGILQTLEKPLQYIDANPIAGVIILDVASAIAPNTAIDTAKRNPIQGFETFRRESSGLVINCILPGIAVGLVAKALKGKILGSEFKGIAADKIWANKDTIDEATDTWKKVSHHPTKEERVKAFVAETFKKVVPNEQAISDLSHPETQKRHKEALDKLVTEILDTEKKEIPKKTLQDIQAELTKIYGQGKGLTINRNITTKDGEKTFGTSMKNYLKDTFALGKAFTNEAVTAQNIDEFAKKLKKLLVAKSFVTMAGVGVLALSMQAINRKITEKTSGKKGYMGYKELDGAPTKEDKKSNLALGKLLSSAWFSSLAFVSMGKLSPETLHFSSPSTQMNQARGLSLLTDVGRVGAAQDKNELKDTTVRDTIIFMNLYVLGDYVQKGVIELAQKFYSKHKDPTKKFQNLNLFNEASKPDKNASLFKKFKTWVQGKSVKSFEEIEGTISDAPLRLRKNIVTGANLAGIAYSLVALGIFTPIFIAGMTNRNRRKQLEKMQTQKATDATQKHHSH